MNSIIVMVLSVLILAIVVCCFFALRCLVGFRLNDMYCDYALNNIPNETHYSKWDVTRFIVKDIHIWTFSQLIKSQNKRFKND